MLKDAEAEGFGLDIELARASFRPDKLLDFPEEELGVIELVDEIERDPAPEGLDGAVDLAVIPSRTPVRQIAAGIGGVGKRVAQLTGADGLRDPAEQGMKPQQAAVEKRHLG